MATTHVEPVFFLVRDVPVSSDSRLDTLEVCLAAERVSGRETVFGAQEIKGMWRIYPLSRESREKLLIEGISLRGHAVTLHNKNPFIVRGGTESPAVKVWISDIPLSVANEDIEGSLIRLGCVIRSSIILEKSRNKDGKLTRFCTGRRFVFISTPSEPLDRTLKVGSFTARIYHFGQPKRDVKDITCNRCLQKGHYANQCPSDEIVCSVCNRAGHKRGSPQCVLSQDVNIDQQDGILGGVQLLDTNNGDLKSDEESGTDSEDEEEEEEQDNEEDENEEEREEGKEEEEEKGEEKGAVGLGPKQKQIVADDNKPGKDSPRGQRGRKDAVARAPRTSQTTLAFEPRPRSQTPKRSRAQLGDSPSTGAEAINPKQPRHEKNRQGKT